MNNKIQQTEKDSSDKSLKNISLETIMKIAFLTLLSSYKLS